MTMKFVISHAVLWGILMMLFFRISAKSQDLEIPKIMKVKGYVKELPYLQFDKNFEHAYPTNLVHNRLNVSIKPNNPIHAAFELRTRLYWGDEVRLTPAFAAALNNANEQIDASILWVETENTILHSNVDRLWIDYTTHKWNFRLGRQRINWSTANIWNPNDLFNTYNFIDFDYEERPGSDALRIHYTVKELSYVEAALSIGKTHDKNVAAVRYFLNRKGYDLQINTGYYRGSYSVGMAWAGGLGNVGFKGEAQYFAPHQTEKQQINAAMEWDYMSKKWGYLALGFLWNSRGLKEAVKDWQMVDLSLSPRNPMPTALNISMTANKEITPLLNASMSLVVAPQTRILILLSTMNYSISDKLDFNFVWQSFFAETNSVFSAISHRAFLRIKWSF
jgi:hypothetical protein